jgi:colanic acid biosynthesis glycosyl transferase WcaI
MKNDVITVFTANYYPEDTAIGLYTSQFTRFLADNGYIVNVITAFPYYPQWEIWDSYKDKPVFFYETVNGCNVYRHKQYIPAKINFAGRIKLMLSYIKGALKNKDAITNTNLVICIVPFTLSIYPASRLARKFKAPLWVHIQDLEFDLATETGVIGKNIFSVPFKKCLTLIERHLLNKATVVSSISHSMISRISTKCNVQNLKYFPNWVSSHHINPYKYSHHPYINKDKFTLLYSGNIGEKQEWEFFIDVCEKIEDTDIEIVIVGDGGFSSTLKKMAAKYNFVKFYPLVEFSALSDLLCSADVHFLFQKADVVDTIMPSKLLGMMASARPSLITGNKQSEVATILNASGGGFFFALDDINPDKVYQTIINLKNSKVLAIEMGEKARNYILDNFSEESVLETVLKDINDTIKRK